MSERLKVWNLWLCGSSGRMGGEIQKALVERPAPFRLIGGSSRRFEGETFLQGKPVTAERLGHALDKDRIEIVLDFSTPEGNALLLEAIRSSQIKGLRVLIGTTGLPVEQIEAWKTLVETHAASVLVAPNTSIGILVTAKAALTAARPLSKLGFDLEITETHHRRKVDAPSGTALFLARTLRNGIGGESSITVDRDGPRQAGEIGVHAVRGGGVFGEHEIRLLGDSEEICISHRAYSRSLFAMGALTLGSWLVRQKQGFYGLLDVEIDDLDPAQA